MVKASSLLEDGFRRRLILAVLLPLEPYSQNHPLLQHKIIIKKDVCLDIPFCYFPE